MSKYTELRAGDVVGCQTVTREGDPLRHRRRVWCVCKCGAEALLGACQLLRKPPQKCRACLGYWTVPDRIRRTWRAMVERCDNPASVNYHRYGARGISVCERWRGSPVNFYADMGPLPTAKHSLDRIDNAGNYEPGNCRWATCREQAENRRSNTIVDAFGFKLCVSEWARRVGTSRCTIHDRIEAGWPPEVAIATPARHYARRLHDSDRLRRTLNG